MPFRSVRVRLCSHTSTFAASTACTRTSPASSSAASWNVLTTASTAIRLATSPAFEPPMPSQTTSSVSAGCSRPLSSETHSAKLSSLPDRLRPTSLAAAVVVRTCPGLTGIPSAARFVHEVHRGTQADAVAVGEDAARDALAVHERAILRIQVRQFNDSSPPLQHRVVPGHLPVREHHVVARRAPQREGQGEYFVPYPVVLVPVVDQQAELPAATGERQRQGRGQQQADQQPGQR